MKVVVVSPHPDDETLGAGGTIHRLKSEGNEVYWLNFTNVINGTFVDEFFVENRKKQIESIIDYYGFDGFFDLALPPCSLESMDKSLLIKSVSECFDAIKPQMVFLPNPEDAHSDHKVAYEVCMVCTKVFRYPYIRQVLTMEILSETDFNKYGKAFEPNYFVDISKYVENKLDALSIYNTEIGEHPFPRSIDAVKALATLRGAESGNQYAEAFRIVKWIN